MEILFLAHRIPYPPNKGDKIRSYHWLAELSQRHTVHLATFVDDPADWAHCATLDALCGETFYRPIRPRRARLRSLAGLYDGMPLSFAFYRDRPMAAFVSRLAAERALDAVLVFSSAMAAYLPANKTRRHVIDFVDVDSDKWRQYAAARPRSPMRWVYGREASTLAREEKAIAAAADASVFVSEAEAALFRRGAAGLGDRVHAIGNGVDADYFDRARLASTDEAAGQAPRAKPRLVFTGAMDYGANVDAVCWFVAEVWPGIRRARSDACLSIVGARPTRRVQALARQPGVSVTGTVADVRPYIAASDVAIAPMRIARGIQNKVLEALAMGRPVVMSPQAAEGLAPTEASFARIAGSAAAFVDAVLSRVDGRWQADHHAARAYVLKHYGWQTQVARLEALLAGESERER